MVYLLTGSGVAREVCGVRPHRAALARGGKRAKIVLKNSRENSDCLCAIETKRYSQRVPIVRTVGYNVGSDRDML